MELFSKRKKGGSRHASFKTDLMQRTQIAAEWPAKDPESVDQTLAESPLWSLMCLLVSEHVCERVTEYFEGEGCNVSASTCNASCASVYM